MSGLARWRSGRTSRSRAPSRCGFSVGHLPARQGGNADGNLLSMKLITDEARAEIATGWLNSSLTQADFAREHEISPRTLRSYLHRGHAGRQEERQVVAQGVGVDIKKLGEVDRLHERVDRLQVEVEALRALLVASPPDAAGRQEPNVPARQDDLVADQAGPTGMEDRHDALGEPESRPDVDGPVEGQNQPLAALTTSSDHPLAGSTPDNITSSGAGKERRRPKRRWVADFALEGPDEEDAGPVDGGDVDKQHAVEPARHVAQEEQPTVTPAPEQSEPVRPIPMPRADLFWWR